MAAAAAAERCRENVTLSSKLRNRFLFSVIMTGRTIFLGGAGGEVRTATYAIFHSLPGCLLLLGGWRASQASACT